MKNERISMVSRVNGFVLERFNAGAWWLLAMFAYAGSRATQMWLDSHYVRSKFPVPFFKGQTTFDAAELKGYYAHMIAEGTLDVYWYVQRIDFVFMLTAFASLFLFGVAALRTIPSRLLKGKLLKVALGVVWVTPFAAGLDAVENFVSFVMLSDPQGFADWLVYPYSSFAVGKFALFVVNYLWVIGVLIGSLLFWFGVCLRKAFGK